MRSKILVLHPISIVIEITTILAIAHKWALLVIYISNNRFGFLSSTTITLSGYKAEVYNVRFEIGGQVFL